MKTKYIPVVKTTVPTKVEKKKLGISWREIRESRNIERLRKNGVSENIINDIIEKNNTRIILCAPYSSYSIETAKNSYLYGAQAAIYIAKKNNMNIIATHQGGYFYIKTSTDNVDKCIKILSPIGRIQIQKLSEKKPNITKTKIPSNNTTEIKVAAKQKRKEINRIKTEMRPYYAALRKGGVSERIKKYNPELASKIEKWLKNKTKPVKKRIKTGMKYTKTSAQIKLEKRNKMKKKIEISKTKKIKYESNNRLKNIEKRKELLKKIHQKTGIQTKIKMVA